MVVKAEVSELAGVLDVEMLLLDNVN